MNIMEIYEICLWNFNSCHTWEVNIDLFISYSLVNDSELLIADILWEVNMDLYLYVETS